MRRINIRCIYYLLGAILLLSHASHAQTNLALNKTTTASTAMTPAGNATDGNSGTRWESNHDVSPSWLRIDLGSAAALTSVVIDWEAANAANYEIQGSNDGSNWTTLSAQTGGTFGARTDTVTVSGSYRYVRIYCTQRSAGNQWGYSIWEVRVFGGGTVTPPPGTNIALNKMATSSPALTGANLAVDGNGDTRWESTHGGGTAWLQVDLGKSYSLGSVAIDWEAANAANYQVQGSTNGSTWSTLATHTGGAFGERTDIHAVAGNYRYLRINATQRSAGNNWGYSIWELRVFGGATGSSSSSSSVTSVSSSSSSSLVVPSSSASSMSSSSVPLGNVVPLYNSSTQLEPVIQYDRGDALVTRIADRARDRHAKEDMFQAYDHFLSFYWEHRTASIEIIDYVAKGGTTIRMNVRTQWPLASTDNRWFYIGVNTVAEFCDNGGMLMTDPYNYYKESSYNCREGRQIQIGDKLEFEPSQFLAHDVPNGRSAYYGTTFLYIVGQGLVPWEVGGATPQGGVKDSVPIPESAWLGGKTTLHQLSAGEPHHHFMQMATNLGYDNGQPFVLGRRLHHTSFVNGTHDERPVENEVFSEMIGKAGPRWVNDSCAGCHVRNGRAAPAPVGEPLDKWVFRVGDANGNPHPQLGRALQSRAASGASSEGEASIAFWQESNGLRSPQYQFSGVTPERFSARIAPQLVGMGLLEAVSESTILAMEDANDANSDGISGRANRVVDPASGQTRLGRFGYKAATSSVKHQVASAFNNDMGVMTSLLPNPDCGFGQSGCGGSGSELADSHLNNLVKYISLLGVRPQRDLNNAAVQRGQTLFSDIGCAGCHKPTLQTSQHHPLAELRDQIIHPYTDLLLHDMGPGLADNLGEGQASGSEWRTAPLWGLGLSACVTGGVINPIGGQGNEVCTPVHSYLHDGRARSIEEAILWHGGEGEAAKNAYQTLSGGQKTDVLSFLRSL